MEKYTKDELACLWLDYTEGLRLHKKLLLLKLYKSPSELFTAIHKDAENIIRVAGAAYHAKLIAADSEKWLNDIISDLKKSNIRAVTYASPDYPDLLKEIIPPPLALYCKGDVSLLKSRCVGIVGTRMCSRYGKEATKKFSADLSGCGFTVVSGMARGIDGVAHETALNAGGKTIAVLASGPEIIYPAEHKYLYQKIIENGLVVSEYKPGTKPMGFQFPERNRIISGLSFGVVVTEAGIKSGALITLDYAVEQNRRTYIVPANIDSRASKGCNERLKAGQGAMITDINDILLDLNLPVKQEMTLDSIELDFLEEKVVLELQKGEIHFDELLTVTNLDVTALNSLLCKMEISGIIKKVSGNFYAL